MKIRIALVALLMVAGLSVTFAQGGFQRPPVAERVKNALEKMAPLSLTDAQKTAVDSAFTAFYTDQDKAIDEMRSSGSMDREAMRAKRDELVKARDEKLQKTLSAEQFEKFKKEIEPEMMPMRRGGGGGRN